MVILHVHTQAVRSWLKTPQESPSIWLAFCWNASTHAKRWRLRPSLDGQKSHGGSAQDHSDCGVVGIWFSTKTCRIARVPRQNELYKFGSHQKLLHYEVPRQNALYKIDSSPKSALLRGFPDITHCTKAVLHQICFTERIPRHNALYKSGSSPNLLHYEVHGVNLV